MGTNVFMKDRTCLFGLNTGRHICLGMLMALMTLLAGCQSKQKETVTKENEPENKEYKSPNNDMDEQRYLDEFRDAYNALENMEWGSVKILPLPEKPREDIRAYFEELERKNLAIPHMRAYQMKHVDYVRNTLKELQRYVSGERKYYPEEEVRMSMDYIYDTLQYDSGHADTNDSIPGVAQSKNYLYQFIAISALASPSLEYLTGVMDAERKVMHLSLDDWSEMWAVETFVFYYGKNGIRTELLSHKNLGEIEKIFNLKDEKNREYYLFVTNASLLNLEDMLMMKKGDRLEYVCTMPGLEGENIGAYSPDGDYEIYFNPRTLKWNFCREKDGVMQIIPGTATIELTLDGMKSKFRWTDENGNTI